LREFDRTSVLLAGASALALTDAGEGLRDRDDVGVVIGSTFGTISSIMHFDLDALREGPLYASPLAFPNTVLNAPAGRIAALFGFRGVNATISTGETSGVDAVIYATEWLRAGRASALLAGSAFGLSPSLARVFPTELGEGAAVFVLEPATSADRAYARVAGFGTAFLPRGRAAASLAAGALAEAIAQARVTPATIDAVVAGGHDPDHHPGLETEVLHAAFGGAPPSLRDFRDCIGDSLDASSGFAIAAALVALERGARSVLVAAFSRSGQSAFLVLTAVDGSA
jgi:3-oxoacyl-[acyl-carrier-protein] synthase II